MITTVLGLCLSAVSAAPQDPPLLNGNQDRVLTTYPLRDLIGVNQARTALPLSTFLEHWPDPDDAQMNLVSLIQGPENTAEALSAEVVLSLLQDLNEAVATDDVYVDVKGTTLFLDGPSQAVGEVLASLRRIESAVARDIVIRASLYRWPDQDAPPTMVSPERLSQIVGQRQPLWSGSARARSGTAVELGQALWSQYMPDVDVEVAQKSWISDPVVRLMFEGVEIVVQPHALIGTDEIAVFCQYAFGERRRMGIRYTGMKEFPALDVPEVALDSGLASARIQNGGALLCSVRSPERAGSQMLLVVSASQTPPPEDQAGSFRAFPISALVSSTRSDLPDIPGVDGIRFPDTATTWGRILDLGDVLDLVQSNVDPDAWGDTATIASSGGMVLVSGEPAIVNRARGLLLQLQDRWLRNTEVEIETVLDAVTSSSGPFAEVSGTGSPASLHRVTYPALTDRTHYTFHGIETLDLRDMDVEIAQAASAANPVVESVFGGIYSSLVPYRTSDGLGTRAQLILAEVAELEPRATRNKDGGDLYLPSTGVARFAVTGPIESGQFTDLGTGPIVVIDNQTYRTRQRMRITLR